MKFELAPLPYPQDALAPHISARTVGIHYEKHHKGYLHKLEDYCGVPIDIVSTGPDRTETIVLRHPFDS